MKQRTHIVRPDPVKYKESMDAAQAFQRIVELGRRSPIEFVRVVFRAEPNNFQKELLEEVRKLEECRLMVANGFQVPASHKKYLGKTGISVRSGKGIGKDAALAWLLIRSLVCFPRPKGMFCAPVAHQLQSIAWAEVSKWLNRRDEKTGAELCPLRTMITVQNNKIFLANSSGKESFWEPRTANPNSNVEEQAETLAGRHEDYMFIFVTEASAVPDAVFRPLETTMTGMCNYAILIWNPTRLSGVAHNTHFGDAAKDWIQLHWNAEECDQVSPEHIEKMVRKYGKDSNMYRVNVKGEPPISDDGALIPWDAAYDALHSELEGVGEDGLRMGIDVGRTGDKTAIVFRNGPEILTPKLVEKNDLTEVAAIVLGERAEFEPESKFLDVNGIGWGVHDIIKNKMGDGYFGVNVTRTSRRPEKFYQLRDELYWLMREAFIERRIKLPKNCDELILELTSLKYDVVLKNGRQVIKVLSKREMKNKGLPSPNCADALALTFYLDESFFSEKKRDGAKKREKLRLGERHDTSWMAL